MKPLVMYVDGHTYIIQEDALLNLRSFSDLFKREESVDGALPLDRAQKLVDILHDDLKIILPGRDLLMARELVIFHIHVESV